MIVTTGLTSQWGDSLDHWTRRDGRISPPARPTPTRTMSVARKAAQDPAASPSRAAPDRLPVM